MKAFEAYDYVLNEYKVKAKDISEKTGISEADISKFRNGKRNIGTELFEQLVWALPSQAKAHFLILFSHQEQDKKLTKKS